MKTKRLPYLNPDRLSVLNQIWVGAVANGRQADWETIFQQHPDWPKILGWDNLVCRRNAYQFLTRKRREAEERTADIPVTLPVESPTADLHFCPRCGFNISMLHAAFQVAMKHTQQ